MKQIKPIWYMMADQRIKKGNTSPSEILTWIPKSMVENNKDGTYTMPEWLALDKGFI